MKKSTALIVRRGKSKGKTQSKTRKSPSAIRTVSTTINNNRKTLHVAHSELIASINTPSSGDYLICGLMLNPGNQTAFPWLSQLALNFEYYNFKNLKFRYVPRCSMMVSGSCVMAVDYDVMDSSPVHMADIANMLGAKPFAVYENAMTVCDPRSLHLYPYRYLRSSGNDPRLEAVGNFFLMINTGDVDTTMGDLWVDYDIELFCPQFAEPSGAVRTAPGTAIITSRSPTGDNNTGLYGRQVTNLSASDSVNLEPTSPGKWLLEYNSTQGLRTDLTSQNFIITDVGDLIKTVNVLRDVVSLDYSDPTMAIRSIQALLDLDPGVEGAFSMEDTMKNYLNLTYAGNVHWGKSGLAAIPALLTLLKVGDSFFPTPSPVPLARNADKQFIFSSYDERKRNLDSECENSSYLDDTNGVQPIPTQDSCEYCGTGNRSVNTTQRSSKR